MSPDTTSFWAFLRTLPASLPAEQFYALMFSGTFGICAHYTMKWARGEIEGDLFHYLFCQYPRNTVLSFLCYGGFAITTIVAHGVDGSSWWAVLWMGLTSGFAVDSIANKGVRPVWSDEKRQETNQQKGTP